MKFDHIECTFEAQKCEIVYPDDKVKETWFLEMLRNFRKFYNSPENNLSFLKFQECFGEFGGSFGEVSRGQMSGK